MQQTTNLNLKKPDYADAPDIQDINDNMDILDTEIPKKVDKVTGKGLSTEDYTTTEKNKLAGIDSGAQVNRAISDSVSSTSTTTNASSKSVKTAYDKAVSAADKPQSCGHVIYSSDTMEAYATLQKTIAIGDNKSQAKVLCRSSESPSDTTTALLFANKNPDALMTITNEYDSSESTYIESINYTGHTQAIADIYSNNTSIVVSSAYISGSNLLITFKNLSQYLRFLKTEVYWEAH